MNVKHSVYSTQIMLMIPLYSNTRHTYDYASTNIEDWHVYI